ncbi:MAG: MerR family transcriptional regulator, partial [Oxalobacteraceae bacterium]
MHAFVDSDVLPSELFAINGLSWHRHYRSAGAQSAYRERSLPAIKNSHPHHIKDVAALVGVTQRTLRFYEEIHLISPQRSSGTRRRYSDADVARVQKITHFAHLGFSLAEVKLL